MKSHDVFLQVDALVLLEFLDEMIDQGVVKILAAEQRVAICGFDLAEVMKYEMKFMIDKDSMIKSTIVFNPLSGFWKRPVLGPLPPLSLPRCS